MAFFPISDLGKEVKETLEANGALERLAGKVRHEVFKVVLKTAGRRLSSASPPPGSVASPRLEEDLLRGPMAENFIIDQLIREYLEWNGDLTTETVFASESSARRLRQSEQGWSLKVGTPAATPRLSREELESLLSVRCGPNSRSVPLLYSILLTFMRPGT